MNFLISFMTDLFGGGAIPNKPLFLKGNPLGTGRSEGSSNCYLMDKVDGKGRSVSSTTIKKKVFHE